MISEQVFEELFPVVTRSPEETIALGRSIGQYLQAGDIVAFYGTLGSGKTHLIKGVASAFGIAPEQVSSPTFAIVQEYSGSLPIYHMDAYRIRSLDELLELGVEEYLYGEGLTLIEWPERMEALLPEHTLRLELRHFGEGEREIRLKK